MRRKNAGKLLFSVALLTAGCGSTLPASIGSIPEQRGGQIILGVPIGLTPPTPSLSPIGLPPTPPTAPLAQIGVPWLEGQSYGGWVSQFSGFGTIQLESTPQGPVLALAPANAAESSSAHAALVTSTASFGDLNATVTALTLNQQQTPASDPWEVAWFLWHYIDLQHFYYILLKPNGWELGKEDPAYPGSQRFLATGETPDFPIGVSSNVAIVQTGGKIQVAVNGTTVVRFTDTQSPYLQGAIGLYSEEASTMFGNVTVNGTPIQF